MLPSLRERGESIVERLDKLLSGTGRWSRKEVHGMARAGRISVDGVVARDTAQRVPNDARIRVDGMPVQAEKYLYLMMNKRNGVVSATQDRRERTVVDELPPHIQARGVFPVGRLDKDTEGLLLLTDDGALAHQILSPRQHVPKRYFARVEGTLTQEDREAFAAGITLRDGYTCLPAKLEILPEGDSCFVTLEEGKYHQVRRMLAARGKPVFYLKRLSIGPIWLDESLEEGAWRPLAPSELEKLRKNT